MYQELVIVVLTFNNYDELILTLNSIPLEFRACIYIVNGGQCPKTSQLIESGAFNGVSEIDKGISDGFNKGVRNSSGCWIHFLNSGDVLLTTDLYKELNNNENLSFVYSNMIFRNTYLGDVVLKPAYSENFNLVKGMPFLHPALIVKREVFEKIGFFDLDYKIAMDYDFVCRMVLAGFKGKYINKETVLMDGSGVSTRHEIKAIAERKRVVRSLGKLSLFNNFLITYYFFKAYSKKFLVAMKLSFLISIIKKQQGRFRD